MSSKLIRIIAISSVALVFLACTLVSFTSTISATTYSINRTQSGLVSDDSLTSGNMTPLIFGGTATLHNYYEDSQGLHLGVRSPSSGQWVNYYAGLPNPKAYLFHSLLTIPDTSVSDGVSNIGLYVEGSDYIPHVGCEAYADSTGYYWDVEQSSDAGNTYKILYISQPSSIPQTQDCTIITNGSNYLKVYIGNNMVFSSTSMSLGMSTPFIVFVQGDTSSSNSMHYGIYQDYYATSDETVKVINNPANAAIVKITDSSGKVLASSPVSSGVATLNVGMYHFPLSATINAYDSSNSIITSSSTNMYGGDIFSISSSSTPPSAPTSLAATAVSPSQINLNWNAPNDNGGTQITGYKIDDSTNGGSTWSTVVANTSSTTTTYSHTGLTQGTTYTYRVEAINSVGVGTSSNTASATTSIAIHPITRVQSGLNVSDPLNNETMTQQQLQTNHGYWIYGGDAPDRKAPYSFSRDTQGLHIGMQAPANGSWAGFYAATPNSNAMLYHAIITTPVASFPAPNQYYENGMYIQTAQPFINYVTCSSITSTFGTVWAVVSSLGNATQGNQFKTLWYDQSSNQPLTRDCTIITNGTNYLKVFMDGNVVYENKTLNLQMASPFNTYLEPQTSYAGQMLVGSYLDYYTTANANLKLTNLPSNSARIDLVDNSGKTFASTPTSSSISVIDIGKYHFPLISGIKVYDSTNNLIASTSSSSNVFGGDVYSVN